MCGFAGFNFSQEKLLKKMAARLAPRGPDGEGFFHDEKISLAHRRLAILDLTEAASQPMMNEERSLCLVYNGEIYNYIELREELERLGCRFRSRSDSEVLLHGYQVWGKDLLPRLNGMFAFAIYDKSCREIFLARDRYGEKPIHYWHLGNQFAFASEIKALLEYSAVSRDENPLAVYDYLSFNCYNHTEDTFFKSIKSILPGHYLTYDLERNTYAKKRWYAIPQETEFSKERSELDLAEEFKTLFFDALRLRQRTDVELGSCLSGGLDSSAIVCGLTSGLGGEGGILKTFSAVIQTPELDESVFMEEVIRETGVHSYKTYPGAEGLLGSLDALVYAQDEPFGGTSIYAQWEVMKLAQSRGIKVLMDGQGGDELLAGYPFFYGYYFLELLRKGRPMKLISEVRHFIRRMPDAFREGILTPFFLMSPEVLKTLLWKQIYGDILNEGFSRKFRGISEIPYRLYEPVDLNEALKRRLKYSLPQLLREEDRSSMAFSVEARLPFLDFRLVHFLMKVPSALKLCEGRTKYLLRQSLKNILPSKIVQRASKLGFTTPLDAWLCRPEVRARMMVDLKMSREGLSRYVDFGKVEKILSGHFSGRAKSGLMIWKLFNLAVWMRVFQNEEIPRTLHR